jgi:hypothetical protein
MPISDPFWMENIERRVHELEATVRQLSTQEKAMAVDISKITADEATLKTAVEQLIAGFTALQAQVAALQTGQVTQAQIDALDKTITDTQAEVTATLTPPATPAKKK